MPNGLGDTDMAQLAQLQVALQPERRLGAMSMEDLGNVQVSPGGGAQAAQQQALAQILPLLMNAQMGGGVGNLQAVQAQNPLDGAPGASVGPLQGTLPQGPRVGESYAPSGRNLNFFGGSPFQPQDRVRQILAGLTLGSRVLEIQQTAKKKRDELAKKAEKGK